MFFTINIPFYWLGWRRLGPRFTVKTFASVGLLSVLSAFMPQWIPLARPIRPWGRCCSAPSPARPCWRCSGTGPPGGIGILALYVQDSTGMRAGWVQMGFDACLFLLAFLVVPPLTVLWSALGAVVLNLVIAINHRRDRYIAM